MKIQHDYRADHTFVATIDTPVVVAAELGRNYEVDQVWLELNWCSEDPLTDDPSGWWVSTSAYGWRLNAKGKRDGRATRREPLFPRSGKYPLALWEAVGNLWTAAQQAGVDLNLILNPDEDMLVRANFEVDFS